MFAICENAFQFEAVMVGGRSYEILGQFSPKMKDTDGEMTTGICPTEGDLKLVMTDFQRNGERSVVKDLM